MSFADPDGFVLIEADSSQAAALLAAADAAGVDQSLIVCSPIRGGYVVPQAVADAYTPPVVAEAPADAPVEVQDPAPAEDAAPAAPAKK